MDNELRGRIQMIAAQEAAKTSLEDLRSKKNEIADAVKADVIPFFATRGVTVTTIGMFGGMSYENEAIQKAIDTTFCNQQEKVNAEALFLAQGKKNERINSEAVALADAARTKALGEADAKKSIYAAEASGINSLNEAIQKAAQNPMLIEMRRIEVEKARMEKWDGKYPSTVVGAGANAWVGIGNNVAEPSKAANPPVK
jgi:hypothetical protein